MATSPVSSGSDYERLASGDRVRVTAVGPVVYLSLLEAPISHDNRRLVRLTPEEARGLSMRLAEASARAVGSP